MNLYGQQQNNNNWLYQPIVVELDDSSYYDEESCSTITSTSSFISSNHISTTSTNRSSGVGPANSALGSRNIVVRGVTPLYISSPSCSTDPSPNNVIGGDCAETTEAQTFYTNNKNHRRRRQNSKSNNYGDYRDYYFEHWRSEAPCDDSKTEASSSSSHRSAFRKRHFRKKGKTRKQEKTVKPFDTAECSEDDEPEVGSSCPSTTGNNTGLKMNFHDVYVLTRQIDKGAFSTVWEAIHRTSGRRYAAKLIDRRTLSPSDDNSIYREVATLRHLHNLPPFRDDDDYYNDYNASSNGNTSTSTRHFATASANLGIIQLIDFYVEPTHFFLVTDYVGGGDLFSRVLERRYYDEETARELARGFFQSLFYLHSRNVVHRDIKPENLLLCSKVDDVQLKIADFGFATRLRRADHTKSRRRGGGNTGAEKEKEEEDYKVRDKCGTPSYVAPEVLRGIPYDTQADMWSAGVVMYFLIGGYPPFVDRKSRKGLFRKICRGEYEFHETDWSDVSEDAKDFIRRLLTLCPEQRMTAEEALSHHWVRGTHNSKKIVSMMGPQYPISSKISSSAPTKPQPSTDTKMTTSMSSATAMSSTTSTITTSHLYISNTSSSKSDHPVSNRVRSARKKLSKVFKSMKDGASGSGSGGNGGGATTASPPQSNVPHHHNHMPLRSRTGTNCSVTVASSQCDESSVEPPLTPLPPPSRRPPRKIKSKVRPPPRRRTGTI